MSKEGPKGGKKALSLSHQRMRGDQLAAFLGGMGVPVGLLLGSGPDQPSQPQPQPQPQFQPQPQPQLGEEEKTARPTISPTARFLDIRPGEVVRIKLEDAQNTYVVADNRMPGCSVLQLRAKNGSVSCIFIDPGMDVHRTVSEESTVLGGIYEGVYLRLSDKKMGQFPFPVASYDSRGQEMIVLGMKLTPGYTTPGITAFYESRSFAVGKVIEAHPMPVGVRAAMRMVSTSFRPKTQLAGIPGVVVFDGQNWNPIGNTVKSAQLQQAERLLLAMAEANDDAVWKGSDALKEEAITQIEKSINGYAPCHFNDFSDDKVVAVTAMDNGLINIMLHNLRHRQEVTIRGNKDVTNRERLKLNIIVGGIARSPGYYQEEGAADVQQRFERYVQSNTPADMLEKVAAVEETMKTLREKAQQEDASQEQERGKLTWKTALKAVRKIYRGPLVELSQQQEQSAKPAFREKLFQPIADYYNKHQTLRKDARKARQSARWVGNPDVPEAPVMLTKGERESFEGMMKKLYKDMQDKDDLGEHAERMRGILQKWTGIEVGKPQPSLTSSTPQSMGRPYGAAAATTTSSVATPASIGSAAAQSCSVPAPAAVLLPPPSWVSSIPGVQQGIRPLSWDEVRGISQRILSEPLRDVQAKTADDKGSVLEKIKTGIEEIAKSTHSGPVDMKSRQRFEVTMRVAYQELLASPGADAAKKAEVIKSILQKDAGITLAHEPQPSLSHTGISSQMQAALRGSLAPAPKKELTYARAKVLMGLCGTELKKLSKALQKNYPGGEHREAISLLDALGVSLEVSRELYSQPGPLPEAQIGIFTETMNVMYNTVLDSFQSKEGVACAQAIKNLLDKDVGIVLTRDANQAASRQLSRSDSSGSAVSSDSDDAKGADRPLGAMAGTLMSYSNMARGGSSSAESLLSAAIPKQELTYHDAAAVMAAMYSEKSDGQGKGILKNLYDKIQSPMRYDEKRGEKLNRLQSVMVSAGLILNTHLQNEPHKAMSESDKGMFRNFMTIVYSTMYEIDPTPNKQYAKEMSSALKVVTGIDVSSLESQTGMRGSGGLTLPPSSQASSGVSALPPSSATSAEARTWASAASITRDVYEKDLGYLLETRAFEDDSEVQRLQQQLRNEQAVYGIKGKSSQRMSEREKQAFEGLVNTAYDEVKQKVPVYAEQVMLPRLREAGVNVTSRMMPPPSAVERLRSKQDEKSAPAPEIALTWNKQAEISDQIRTGPLAALTEKEVRPAEQRYLNSAQSFLERTARKFNNPETRIPLSSEDKSAFSESMTGIYEQIKVIDGTEGKIHATQMRTILARVGIDVDPQVQQQANRGRSRP